MWQEMRPLWVISELFKTSSAKQRKGRDHLANFQTCLFSPGCEPWTTAGFPQPANSLHATTQPFWQITVPCPESQALPASPFTLCNTGKKTTPGETLTWIEISC